MASTKVIFRIQPSGSTLKLDRPEVHMAEWSPDRPDMVKWIRKPEARRQNRLADLMRPHLGPDEHIVAIFSILAERLSRWGPSGSVAVVVTNQRLVVIGFGGMRGRPKKILASYSHDGLKIESNRTARKVPVQYGQVWYGKLTVTGSFGTKEFWVGTGMRDSTHAIAQTLDEDSRLG